MRTGRSRTRRRSLIVLGATLLVGVAAAPAPAATGQASFALVPQHFDPALRATRSYFVAVAAPGTTFRNSVRVVNTGKATGTAYLYAVDATTGKTSGAVYLDRTKPRRGVGSWVTLGEASVRLGPGESRVVPVSVVVPANARHGDHLGGIVAENAALTQASGRGALRIRVRHLTIAAVEVQVPGTAAARGDVTRVFAGGENGYQYVYLHLKNTGLLTSKPAGRLLVRDGGGAVVASRPLELDTFLPGTQIDYPVLLPGKALGPGTYHAVVTLSFGSTPLGYRRTAGPATEIRREFDFTVSGTDYTTVFKGVQPVTPRTRQAAPSEGSKMVMLAIAGGFVALLAAVGALVYGARRWSTR